MKQKRLIVGCESSQVASMAFYKLGWKVTSVDLLPSDQPDSGIEHITGDIFEYLDSITKHEKIDLLLAFPPCTNLTSANAHQLRPKGWQEKTSSDHSGVRSGSVMERDLEIVRRLMFDYPMIEKRAIENPSGVIGTRLPMPDGTFGLKASQFIQPYNYGHGWCKRTGLWLFGLPLLQSTNPVDGRSNWLQNLPPTPDRWKIRSKLCQGFADAMATQWTNL